MKTVVKHGKYYKTLFAICERCGCQFDFSQEELTHSWDTYVTCPECNNSIYCWSYRRQDVISINKEE